MWRRTGRLLALLPLLCGALASCAQGATGDAQITLNVVQPVVGTTPIDVMLAGADGQPISGAQVQLRGDMTHAGMQPVLVTMDDLGNGHYRADDFAFTMAGDWVLTVQAQLPNGARAERMFEVQGVE